MLWLDNLDDDFCKNSRPGPSGIHTNSNVMEMIEMTPVEEFKPEIDREIIEEKIKGKCDQDENNQDTNKRKDSLTISGDKKNEDSPAIVFAEHVTIAGLEEAFKAEFLPDRYMYRVALFLVLIMIIVDGYAIWCRYRDLNTIFNDIIKNTNEAPFPNITICFPANDNDTFIRHEFEYGNLISDKDNELMRKLKINFDDVLNYIKDVFLQRLTANTLSTLIFRIATKIFEKALQKFQNQQNGLPVDLFKPSCSSILSNCVYNRRKFDCCKSAQFLTLWTQSCYLINPNDVIESKNRPDVSDAFSPREPLRLTEAGFSVDVNNDWNFGLWDDGSASDGFYIFVGILPSPNGDPTVIPADMDATIIVGQPIRVNEKSQCRSNEKKSDLKLFDDYDPYGRQCSAEMLTNLIYKNLGCSMPMLSAFLALETCSLNGWILLSLFVGDAGGDVNADQDQSRFVDLDRNAAETKYSQIFQMASKLPHKICLPLCSRWSYKILSASYGSIKYHESYLNEFQASNRSWSRLRFVMPWESYTEHNEEWVAKTYLAICDIGGMMGVYAGFSMITFIQLVFYGYYWWSKRKKRNQVAPANSTNK